MNLNRLLGIAALILAGAGLVYYTQEGVFREGAKYTAAVTGVMAVFAWMVKNDQLSKFQESLNDDNGVNSLSDQSLETIVRQWADQRGFTFKFDWDKTDYDNKPLRDWSGSNGFDHEILSYAIGVKGANNVPTLVFVEMTSGKVVGYKTRKSGDKKSWKHMVTNPYRYSEYYQEYKRRTGTNEVDSMNAHRNMQGFAQPFVGGMPMRQPEQNSGDGESEDE